ncbi:MAG TPA: SDR family NAD(P)-dependent oxidoreductase, partial [Acetobacteraceae bacterium]|nr:SDR family NAD(P)-dependent oxidoreductase [Acetobacteraceae bacterium]
MAEFAGKRIVITGGAGGIGVATARAFLDQGAHILLIDVDAARLDEAKAALGGTRIFTAVSDLATPAACAALMQGARPVHA